ncbi:hypothetical protein A2V49_01085 [candidate division WWE3 bacterium RBG_19FT_COMBO_34_6]|uniref:Uncharacterized protein n=1 Tax=candidate division WWE3 bacterium RBG_19FT_COMBO_34_6 TaxID=1802612 RepID=A0A1F4UKQ0_UNCKA|nr:MAG: hypothetical protein A2V49_01085 [candidate division WWE3 bacterium RBG_19FT_COMBO_34_6]
MNKAELSNEIGKSLKQLTIIDKKIYSKYGMWRLEFGKWEATVYPSFLMGNTFVIEIKEKGVPEIKHLGQLPFEKIDSLKELLENILNDYR